MASFGSTTELRSKGPAKFDERELDKRDTERRARDKRIRKEEREKAAKESAKDRAKVAELEGKLEKSKKSRLPSRAEEAQAMHGQDDRLATLIAQGLDRNQAKVVAKTVDISIDKGDSPEKAKKAVEKKFTDEEKKEFDMNALLGLVPLFLMQQGGGIFGNDSSDASKEETAAEIERMEGMIEDLKQLRKEVKTEKESGPKEINKGDVDEALTLCKKKNEKYKAYLSELEKYSVGLEKIAQKIVDGVEKNIDKSKKLCGKKSKSTSKNNESEKKDKGDSKKSKK